MDFMKFVNFLIENYIWIVVVFGILIISIIGFLADRYNKNRKAKIEAKKNESGPQEPVNIVDINGDNVINDAPEPLVTEEIITDNESFDFPETTSDEPEPIAPVNFESNSPSFDLPEVENGLNFEEPEVSNGLTFDEPIKEDELAETNVEEPVIEKNDLEKSVDAINSWENSNQINDLNNESNNELDNEINSINSWENSESEEKNEHSVEDNFTNEETLSDNSNNLDNTISDEDFWKL